MSGPHLFVQARRVGHDGVLWQIEAGWDLSKPAAWAQLVSEESRIGRALTSLERSLGPPKAEPVRDLSADEAPGIFRSDDAA